MSTSPVVALRKAILAHLTADAAFVGALGGAKVFDEAPRNVEPPYVVFADAQMRDWSAQLSRGAEQFVVLSVWSTQRGQREALDIAQKVVDLLDEAPLVLQDHALVDLRFAAAETKREQNGRFARVNLRFRATTESV
ncbi:MAG: DUF3168 domain-containing protein [Methylocystis sp.]|nr:DUF3168 domain-containing protein [Methylocystis sp.]MBI3275018.1 DUF3168 domain-containing protein [Methylocystis sp.]